MNQICKKMAVLGSTLMLAAIAQSAMANQGKIDFEGGVTDTTCDVIVNNQTNDALVKLPIVSSKLLRAAGDVAGRTFLNFDLKNCSLANGITKAKVFFKAGATINPAGRLNNMETAAGATTNVDLQILNTDLKPMNLAVGVDSQGATPVTIDATAKTAKIQHFVEYYATAQSTAGSLKSSVEYEISYE